MGAKIVASIEAWCGKEVMGWIAGNEIGLSEGEPFMTDSGGQCLHRSICRRMDAWWPLGDGMDASGIGGESGSQLTNNKWVKNCHLQSFQKGMCVPWRIGSFMSRNPVGKQGTTYLSWYDLPSPSLATSGHLQPLLPLLHPFCLHSTPTPKHTCTTYAAASHPLSD